MAFVVFFLLPTLFRGHADAVPLPLQTTTSLKKVFQQGTLL